MVTHRLPTPRRSLVGKTRFAAAAALALSLLGPLAQAQTYTWIGGSGEWSQSDIHWLFGPGLTTWSNDNPPNNARFVNYSDLELTEDIVAGTITLGPGDFEVKLGSVNLSTLEFDQITSGGKEITVWGNLRLVAKQSGAILDTTLMFVDHSVLELEAASSITGGTITFSDQSRLNVDVSDAITGGTQLFKGDSVMTVTGSLGVNGGSLKFSENAKLEVKGHDAIVADQLVFSGSSVLEAHEEGGIIGRDFDTTIQLDEEATLKALGVNSIDGVAISFGASGTGGTLDLRASEVTIRGLLGSKGVIESNASAGSMLILDTGVLGSGGEEWASSSNYGGILRDGSSPLGILLTGTVGRGMLFLTGSSNTYSGGTTVERGDLFVYASGALGTGFVKVNSGYAGLQVMAGVEVGQTISLTNGGSLINLGVVGGDEEVAVTAVGGGKVTNRGVILGDVVMDDAANEVNLYVGSSITGDLQLGGHEQSTLFLRGTGSQLFSTAVGGEVSLAGNLNKSDEGKWIIDTDLEFSERVWIANGELEIDGGSITGSQVEMRVGGSYGTNHLNITNGVVEVASIDVKASAAMGASWLTVSGSQARLSLADENGEGQIFIGTTGTAGMWITGGGTVTYELAGGMGIEEESWTTALISGEGSLLEGGAFFSVASEGKALLTLQDGGTLRLTDPDGTLYIASYSSASASVSIGGEVEIDGTVSAATAAGLLDVPYISFGEGNGALYFNHTDTDYQFAATVDGAGWLTFHAGTTTVSGSNSYTGGTFITKGIVHTSRANAFGNGNLVFSTGGELNPHTSLHIGGHFFWFGGALTQTLGTADTSLFVAGDLVSATMVESNAFTVSAGAGFAGNTAYTLLAWSETSDISNFPLGALSVNSLSTHPMLTPMLHQVGNTMQVIFLGAVTGPVLQNSGPYFTPTDANFVVSESVATGTVDETNTVNSLIFRNDGALTIHKSLTLQGGFIAVEGGGNSAIVGDSLVAPGDFEFDVEGSLVVMSEVSLSGTLHKTGSGLLGLLAASNQSATFIEEGTLMVASDTAFGTGGVSIADATLRTSGYIVSERLLTLLGDATLHISTQPGTLSWRGQVVEEGGSRSLTKAGEGRLELHSANTYTGGTVIGEGTLATYHAGALGAGAVHLQSGATLEANGQLALASLLWDGGGSIAVANGGWLDIAGALEMGSAGLFAFELAALGIVPNASYTLATFGSLIGFEVEDFTADTLFGLAPTFSIEGNRLVVLYEGTAKSGPFLQNSGPYYTPPTATFTVSGTAQTGTATESNTVAALVFEDGGHLHVHNTLSVTSGSFHVAPGHAVLAGEEVETPGNFTKTGAGFLHAENRLIRVHGDAFITQGGLVNNTTFEAGTLYVGPQAYLGGSGVVEGNVVIDGTLNPGNSPGTLTVVGNHTQSGVFVMEIGSSSWYDRLEVSGIATVGGRLQVVQWAGYRLELGQKFKRFITAAEVRGGFDKVEMPSGLRGRILEKSGALTLLVAPERYSDLARTPNQKRTARALDRWIGTEKGDVGKVTLALDELRADQYPQAFEAISPAYYEVATGMALELSQTQGRMLGQQLYGVRNGPRGFRNEAQLPVYTSGKQAVKEDILIPTDTNRWGVWTQANGVMAKLKSPGDLPRTGYQSGGFLLGTDYAWSDRFVTGLFGGYQGAFARYNPGGNTFLDSARFGGYATWGGGGGLYADAIAGGGSTHYQTKRPIRFGSVDRNARADTHGNEFFGILGGGYDWKVGHLSFGPSLSAQYTHLSVNGFTERGASSLNLRVDRQRTDSLRSYLGARVSYQWQVCEGFSLTPEARAFWQHEYLQDPYRFGAALAGGSGPGFSYQTGAPSRDALFTGIGLNARFGERWDVNLNYDADLGRGDTFSHSVSAGVKVSF